MKLKPDQERVRTLLTDTVTLLCKNGLQFQKNIKVQGLLGITLDNEDVFVVHINEILGDLEKSVEAVASSLGSEDELVVKRRSSLINPSPRKRRRSRHNSSDSPQNKQPVRYVSDSEARAVAVKAEPDEVVMIDEDTKPGAEITSQNQDTSHDEGLDIALRSLQSDFVPYDPLSTCTQAVADFSRHRSLPGIPHGAPFPPTSAPFITGIVPNAIAGPVSINNSTDSVPRDSSGPVSFLPQPGTSGAWGAESQGGLPHWQLRDTGEGSQEADRDGKVNCTRCAQFREKYHINRLRQKLRKEGVPETSLPPLPKITCSFDGMCKKCVDRGKRQREYTSKTILRRKFAFNAGDENP